MTMSPRFYKAAYGLGYSTWIVTIVLYLTLLLVGCDNHNNRTKKRDELYASEANQVEPSPTPSDSELSKLEELIQKQKRAGNLHDIFQASPTPFVYSLLALERLQAHVRPTASPSTDLIRQTPNVNKSSTLEPLTSDFPAQPSNLEKGDTLQQTIDYVTRKLEVNGKSETLVNMGRNSLVMTHQVAVSKFVDNILFLDDEMTSRYFSYTGEETDTQTPIQVSIRLKSLSIAGVTYAGNPGHRYLHFAFNGNAVTQNGSSRDSFYNVGDMADDDANRLVNAFRPAIQLAHEEIDTFDSPGR